MAGRRDSLAWVSARSEEGRETSLDISGTPEQARAERAGRRGGKRVDLINLWCCWWGWGSSCVPLIYQLTHLWEERRLLLEIINGLERGAGLPRHEAIKSEKGVWLQRLSGPACNE